MAYPTSDLRIKSSRIVLPPIFLKEEISVTDNASRTVFETRRQIIDILNGSDCRLVVIVGPCSIHDPIATQIGCGVAEGGDRRAFQPAHACVAWSL